MPKAGNYAAYQQSTPIREDFGDNMLQAENMQFRYREEQRREEEAKRRRQLEDDARLATDLEKMKHVITGVKSVDEINYRAVGQATHQLGEIHRQLNTGNLTQAQRQDLLLKKGTLTKFPELLKGASERIQKQAATLSEGIQNGTVSEWDLQELEKIEAFFGVKGEDGRMSPNYVIDFDEAGNPVGKLVTQSGEYHEIPFLDIYNGGTFNSVTQSVNSDQYTKGIVDNLGKRQQAKIEGGLIQTYQNFDSQREGVSGMLDAALGSENDPSDLAKSIWADADNLGKSPKEFGKGSIKEIKDFLINKIQAGYDQTMSASQYRYQSSSDGSTATERKKQQLAISVYENTNKAAQGDAEALGLLKGRTKKVGKDYVTASDAFLSGDNIVITDQEGNTLESIPMSESQEVRASKLLAWFTDGDPSEGRDLYNLGAQQFPDGPPQARSVAKGRKAVEEPAVDVSSVKKMDINGNPRDIALALKNEFKESGFKFVPNKNWFSSNEIEIIAPNGNSKMVKVQNNANAKQEIYNFMYANQVQTRTVYVDQDGEEQPQQTESQTKFN